MATLLATTILKVALKIYPFSYHIGIFFNLFSPYLSSILTFLTVRSLPTGEAYDFSRLRACIMSKLIITWPAEIRTPRAIIMWITGDTKIVFQPSVLRFRFVGFPFR